MAVDADSMVAIGRISRPHGVNGVVRVVPLTDTPGRLSGLGEIVVEKPDRTVLVFSIEHSRDVQRGILLKFVGIDSFEQAEGLRSAYLLVPRASVPALPQDTFYVFELIGYRVETVEGEAVGVLDDILRLPANDVYVVRKGKREVLIPAVGDFVRIDAENRRIVVDGVEDLLS